MSLSAAAVAELDRSADGRKNTVESIGIRLDPAKLEHADLDFRYEISDHLAQRSAGLIRDSGYDYESDGNALQIYLQKPDLASAVPQVVSFFETERLHGNLLARAAQVKISDADASTATEFRVVCPPGRSAVILPPAKPGTY
jgi:hypothetical protein